MSTPENPYGQPQSEGTPNPYGQSYPTSDQYNQQQYGQGTEGQAPYGGYGDQPFQAQQPYAGYDQQNGYQQPYGAYGQQPYVQPPTGQKSKIVAGILGILLGVLGVHNFYLGYTGKAVAQLLITLVSLGALSFISAIWGLIEGVLILISKPGDKWHRDARGFELQD